MKGIDLLHAMNDIDDSFIDEASVVEKKAVWMKVTVQRVLPLAAVLILGFMVIRPFIFSAKYEAAATAGAAVEENGMVTEDMSAVMYNIIVMIQEPSDFGYYAIVIDSDELVKDSVVELVTDVELMGKVSIEFYDYDRDSNKIYVIDAVSLE